MHSARPIERTLAVVGLTGVALIHVLDLHDTFSSTPYQGWLYVGLIAGALACAGLLIRADDSRAWAGAALLPLGAFLAFVWSRTIGLPGGADDIGNWWQQLGVASLFVEGVVVALAGSVLAQRVTFALPERRGLPAGVRAR
jgi:hypothetical protein